jgi:hypothetical protein
MPTENKFERVPEDSPERCQGVGKTGQCPFKRIDGSEFCPRCAGASQGHIEKKKMSNYRLNRWQRRMEDFAESDTVKSLRDEIGITRMLLEEILNQCKDETDLLMHSNRISDLVIKIEKLVTSCHRLEKSSSMLLDKNRITHLANIVVDVIGEFVEDEDVIMNVAEKLLGEIMTVKGKEDE